MFSGADPILRPTQPDRFQSNAGFGSATNEILHVGIERTITMVEFMNVYQANYRDIGKAASKTKF